MKDRKRMNKEKEDMKDVTPNAAAPQGFASLASRFLDVAALPWHEPFPGLRMKVLYKDDEAKEATILFETQPGMVIPFRGRFFIERKAESSFPRKRESRNPARYGTKR